MRFAAGRVLCILGMALLGLPGEVQALSIRVQPGAGLTPAAVAAIERGVRLWERMFSDPVTVDVEVAMADLGDPRMLAKTSPVFLEADYAEIRDAITAHGSAGAPLPAVGEFSATLPPGFTLGSVIEGTKANFKALGLVGLDEDFGSSDASILLNTTASFDTERNDGIAASQIDLQGLVAHEVAHVLGFVSSVDRIDSAMDDPTRSRSVDPTPLDLFRFGTDSVPLDADSFGVAPRNLVPGTESVFSAGGSFEFAFSTGRDHGDGRQASHWKDDELAGEWVGVVDPTIDPGMVLSLSQADLFALDAVGWNAVPEPSVGTLMGVGLFLLGARRYSAAGAAFRSGRAPRGWRNRAVRPCGKGMGFLDSYRNSAIAQEALQHRESSPAAPPMGWSASRWDPRRGLFDSGDAAASSEAPAYQGVCSCCR